MIDSLFSDPQIQDWDTIPANSKLAAFEKLELLSLLSQAKSVGMREICRY
ncbi:protein of unknown function [Methylotuvimicrobium alcaliphilum 20Z]|uniref:Uncharacterized protein n=1 Tax=Methylotuvimicrobium alcaliphilum (strain DSM 19304 / NCIMB 14124 / VKM B-2133 / 20Z) TaxID=1091494 RepID=G4SVK2_META2|nr:protein of unknown function [Methylotuvimicrobium alcaliphilum 20Z]